MLKKTITFTDFDGNKRTEDFYFNLSKAELTEMHFSVNGGLDVIFEKIVKEQDNKLIIEYFKQILLKAYGVKTPDGRKFIKNSEVIADFVSTEAYSQLFMELATNSEYAVIFVNSLLPADMQKAKQSDFMNDKPVYEKTNQQE